MHKTDGSAQIYTRETILKTWSALQSIYNEQFHVYNIKSHHVSGIAALPPIGIATDAVETQPLHDIMAQPVGDSLLPSDSPQVPSSKIRADFQSKKAKRESPGSETPLAALIYDSECFKDRLKETGSIYITSHFNLYN